MSLTFPTSKLAWYPNANFLDDISSFSAAGWVRFDTITTANQQFVFSHKGGTNQLGLRKDATTDHWKFSTTVGGVNVVNDLTTPVAGTKYHVAVTWTKNSSTGQKLYVDGALIDTDSTTGQTVNYDSGGGSSLILASRTDTGSNFGVNTLENWCFWPGVLLTANQIAQLRLVGWYHLVGLPAPAVFWSLLNGASVIKDWSGNGRHITSATMSASGITDGGLIGKWEKPRLAGKGAQVQTAVAAPPGPNPWIEATPDTLHPLMTKQISGLVNDTPYEFKVNAVDDAGNVSADSAIVQATPSGATVIHTVKRRLLG